MLDMQPTQISPPMISPSISPYLRDSVPTIDRHDQHRLPCHETNQPCNWFNPWLMLITSGLLANLGSVLMGSVARADLVPAPAIPVEDEQSTCFSSDRRSQQTICGARNSCFQHQDPTCATDEIKRLAIAKPEVVALTPYGTTPLPPLPSEMTLALAEPQVTIAATPPTGQSLDLKPEVIENSPLLQRWLREIPDITSEITNSPSFRTRLRVGYSQFPSSNQSSGINVGLEDVFLGRSGFTVSGDYYSTLNGQRQAWGADLHYYMRPLGSYINIAPVVGYRRLDTTLYSTDGLNVGLRLVIVLSRGGGADFSLTQTWLAPGSDREVGILNFSAGYALTSTLRLSADVQQQNARQRQDSRAAIVLEWLL